MFCANCGSKMRDNDNFCSKCGVKGNEYFKLDDDPVLYEDIIFDESYSDKKVKFEDLGDYEKHYDYSIAQELLKKLRKVTRNKPAFIAGAAGAVVLQLVTAYSTPFDIVKLDAEIDRGV